MTDERNWPVGTPNPTIDGPGVVIQHRDSYVEPRTKTHSGLWVNPLGLRVEDISLVDIAYALSNQTRFYGMHGPHTIAQHSVMVMRAVHDEQKLAAILHDSPEAYLGDMSNPIKHSDNALGRAYKFYEDKAARVIEQAFGLRAFAFDHPDIKFADKLCFREEWEGLVEETEDFEVWDHDRALRAFLAAYELATLVS